MQYTELLGHILNSGEVFISPKKKEALAEFILLIPKIQSLISFCVPNKVR